jgi:heat shock protein HslJ
MKKTILGCIVFSTLLMGCQTTNENYKTNKTNVSIEATDNMLVPNNHLLKNTSWKLVEFNNKEISKEIVTIHFQDNIYSEYELMISGKSGCNSYNGSMSINIKYHKIDAAKDRVSTEKYCSKPLTRKIENAFFNVLDNNTKFEKHDSQHLLFQDDLNTFIFKKTK